MLPVFTDLLTINTLRTRGEPSLSSTDPNPAPGGEVVVQGEEILCNVATNFLNDENVVKPNDLNLLNLSLPLNWLSDWSIHLFVMKRGVEIHWPQRKNPSDSRRSLSSIPATHIRLIFVVLSTDRHDVSWLINTLVIPWPPFNLNRHLILLLNTTCKTKWLYCQKIKACRVNDTNGWYG